MGEILNCWNGKQFKYKIVKWINDKLTWLHLHKSDPWLRQQAMFGFSMLPNSVKELILNIFQELISDSFIIWLSENKKKDS